MSRYVKAAQVSDLASGAVKQVTVEGKILALARVGDTFYAVEDRCSHDDGPLAEGVLDGTAIECPRHGARFDVKTGAVLCMPAVSPIKSFSVKVEGSDVLISVES